MATPNTYFQAHKGYSLSGAGGTGRRVWHSLSNYVTSTDRTAFGIKAGKNPLKDGVRAFGLGESTGAGANVLNAGGQALGLGGMAAGITTLSVAALGSAAAIAALSGPQAAVTAGVVGIVLLAKSAYSNREAAHVALAKYTWSLIDDVPPTTSFTDAAILNEASSAALTLMEDGKNQIKLVASKLAVATQELAKLNAKLMVNEQKIGQLSRDPAKAAETMAAIDRIKSDSARILSEGNAQGGAIYNYVRRLVHTGNYIQAPHIIALAMKEKHSKDSVVNKPNPDYFLNTELGDKSREFLRLLATIYTDILKPVDAAGVDARVTAGAGAAAPVAPTVRRTGRP